MHWFLRPGLYSGTLLTMFGSIKQSYYKNLWGIVNKMQLLSSLAILGSSQYKINYPHSKSSTAGLLFPPPEPDGHKVLPKGNKGESCCIHSSIIQIICSLLCSVCGGAVFEISTNANLINPLNRNKQSYQDFRVNIHHWNYF